MSARLLLVGIAIGVVLAGGGLALFAGGPTVDADAACNDRFSGGNWSGEQVDTDLQNQSVTLQCTNGDRTETIGVDIDVEVNG